MRRILFLIFVSISIVSAQWPEYLSQFEKSLCVVEYYLPQFEVSEIQDDSRFKRSITGILVSEAGLVITSDVIFPANLDILGRGNFLPQTQAPPEDITISFIKNKKHKASFIGKDEELRLAFIKIKDEVDLPDPVIFGKSPQFKRGEAVYLIQHLDGRFDNEIIITRHHINAIIERPKQQLMLASEIQPLSAGGLAVGANGMPYGVVYRGSDLLEMDMDMPSAAQSLVQVLPSHYLTDLIKNPPRLTLQRAGSGKSWLGIQMQILSKDMAEYWKIPGTYGIIVNSVVPKSPAEEAGIVTGDIITAIADLKIGSEDRQELDVFRNYIRLLPEGNTKLSLIRNGQKKDIDVDLQSAPKSQALAEEISEKRLRFTVKELTQDIILANDLDFDTRGVWVSRIEEAGAASLGGLQVNDLIISVNDKIVDNLDGFKETMQSVFASDSEYLQFFVMRNNRTQFVFIKSAKTL
jgi:serine protease Do